jgi:chalcone isomerase-like protein
MMKKILVFGILMLFLVGSVTSAVAEDREILGVTFPGEKMVEGKTLKLNGVAYRKALGIIKVFVTGLYLENPTQSADEVINSEQVKHLVTHYLTSRATAKAIKDGVGEAMAKCNPPDLVAAHQSQVDLYISWMDKDMAPGLTAESTYVPGKGLTYTYQGELKGTIPGSDFMKLYYNMSFNEKAPKRVRKGLLGL